MERIIRIIKQVCTTCEDICVWSRLAVFYLHRELMEPNPLASLHIWMIQSGERVKTQDGSHNQKHYPFLLCINIG